MTVPAQRSEVNVRLSIQKAIKDRIETPNTTPSGRGYAAGWVNYDVDGYDVSERDHWIDFQELENGAGSFAQTTFQLALYLRTSATNRLTLELNYMADIVKDAFRENESKIDLYDFSVLASPVLITTARLEVVNSAGKWGEPEEVPREHEAPDGVVSRVMTYSVRISPDDYIAYPRHTS